MGRPLTLAIDGMTCAGCVSRVERAIQAVPGVGEVSVNLATGPFPKERYQWHRLVPRAASRVAGSCTLAVPEGRSHVYLRARQLNGQIAWASPVFLNYR